MENLLIQIERIIRKEIKTAHDELRDELREEIKMAHDELRSEFKADNAKLRAEFKSDFDELKSDYSNLKESMEELRGTVCLMEFDHGRKLDAIFDYISLNQQKEQEKKEFFEKLENRVDRNQLRILNHENRIEVLEESFNS